jgi:hypothetical protein
MDSKKNWVFSWDANQVPECCSIGLIAGFWFSQEPRFPAFDPFGDFCGPSLKIMKEMVKRDMPRMLKGWPSYICTITTENVHSRNLIRAMRANGWKVLSRVPTAHSGNYKVYVLGITK